MNEPNVSEKLHEIIAEHNTVSEKTFYYSEEEVRELCFKIFVTAVRDLILDQQGFDIWWEHFKKK